VSAAICRHCAHIVMRMPVTGIGKIVALPGANLSVRIIMATRPWSREFVIKL
jgi:hypothetical protein